MNAGSSSSIPPPVFRAKTCRWVGIRSQEPVDARRKLAVFGTASAICCTPVSRRFTDCLSRNRAISVSWRCGCVSRIPQLIGSDGRRLARIVAEAAERPIDAALAESIDRRAGEIYDLLNTDPRPLPGVHRLLVVLEGRRIAWAIATSSRSDQVDASIRAL